MHPNLKENGVPILRGEHVYLGPLPKTEAFEQEYCAWLNHDRVREGTGDSQTTLKETQEVLRDWDADPSNLTFAIFEAETNEPIGDVCLRYGMEKYDNAGPETAIMVAKSHGKGRGTEAMRLVLEYAFGTLKLEIINLHVFTDNLPAIKLYARLGFSVVREEKDRQAGKEDYVMRLTREDWNKKQ